MKSIFQYLTNYKGLLRWTLLLATINQVFSLLDPQIFRRLIDEYVTKYQEYTQQEFIMWICIWAIALIVVALISRLAKSFQDYYVNVMTQKIWMSLYQNALRHIFALPYQTFEDQQSGQLLQKLQKARTDIQNFISTLIAEVFVGLVWLTFVVIYAFTVHRLIGLMFFMLVPIMWITFYYMSKKIKEAQRIIVQETSALAGSTTESIRNVELIKSMGLVTQEMNRLEITNTKVLEFELKKIKLLRWLLFTQWTIINFLRTAIMVWMFWFVYTQAMSLWEFMTLFFYSFFIFGPIRQAWEIINKYQDASASNELVEELMNQTPETIPDQPISLKNKSSNWLIESLSFENVSFSYSNEKSVLQDINLSANSWETIAFVWPSWAGKTTILKLLYRLYQPVKWEIKVNGIDLNDLKLTEYKNMLGIVSQESQLFSGTIKQNLLFAKPDATDEECIEALKQASLHKLILESDQGLSTLIGEAGLKLSWGQKQRLAIARALLRKPWVLIFDEATSSLDSIIEAEITQTIKDITASHHSFISILVAHRLSTVMHAKRIYVLEAGKIIEQGTHTELLQSQWLYAAMWRQQSWWL